MAHIARAPLAQRVANRIAQVRRERQLTQEQLASRLGMAVKNLQRVESGKQNLTLQTIARVAAALDVDDLALLCAPTSPLTIPRPVPVLPLNDAARWVDTRALDRLEAWMLLSVPDDQHFVCLIDDSAMAPLIPAGTWSLFHDGLFDVKSGGVFLMQHSDGRAMVRRVRYVETNVVLERADGGPPTTLAGEAWQQWRAVGAWRLVLAAPVR